MVNIVDGESEADVTFDVLVMRFFGIGRYAIDFNIYGITRDKYATLSLGPAEVHIQNTNRHGKPSSGDFIHPGNSSWKLRDIQSAHVFKTPLWMAMGTIDASRYPVGLLLDMGWSGWNLALFSLDFDSLLQAFNSHDLRIDRQPRRLTPLVVRRG